LVFALTATVQGQSPTPATVEKSERDSVIEALATKLSAGYVLPAAVGRITQALRSANSAGEYDGKAPKEFADAINRTLMNASHDKHLAVFYQPAPTVSPEAATPSVEQRERLNFGFGKLERLRGNVGFLELVNFSDLRQQSAETASALLSTLANFDAIILDLRRNNGGNTPMGAFIATYFFDATRVHLSDIYWRDTNETNQFWTTTFVPGRRSARQPLYILTSTSTFSAFEDFCYSLQNLKRRSLSAKRQAEVPIPVEVRNGSHNRSPRSFRSGGRYLRLPKQTGKGPVSPPISRRQRTLHSAWRTCMH
jgi:hypothetical protein